MLALKRRLDATSAPSVRSQLQERIGQGERRFSGRSRKAELVWDHTWKQSFLTEDGEVVPFVLSSGEVCG